MKSPRLPLVALRVVFLGLGLCLAAPAAQAGQVPLPLAGPQTKRIAPEVQQEAPQPTPPLVKMALAESVSIPGPLRSFLRMAGISQKAQPADVFPLLAHGIYQRGYRGAAPTEYLLLVERYVRQARELQVLAGSTNSIRVANCDDAGKLLQILGYRLRHGCGGEIVLETANAERAFLTIDSGFPLTELEESLQKSVPFVYPYESARTPVLFKQSDWVSVSAVQKAHYGSCLDILLNDPAIARLYWAMSKVDSETASYLQRTPGLRALMPYAPMLDFYGSQISVRKGRVLVPGGAGAEPAWKALVGANPESPASFTTHLLAKDDGWLAAYFDVLARVDASEQQHLTQAARLQHNYEAFRGVESKGGASTGVFRQASGLLVLDSRLAWESNGDPHVPGNLDVWKQMLEQHSGVKGLRDLSKRARAIERPDQLIETMTALSRVDTETGPLQLYLTLCELDRRRPQDRQISPETVKYLGANFALLSHWYLIFSEFPGLSDESLVRFVNVAQGVEQVHNQTLRANAVGAFQANVGLWQILARQAEIPKAGLDKSWRATIEPFAKITSSGQLFDSCRASLSEMLRASGAGPNSQPSEIVSRLAGPPQESPEGRRMHDELSARMRTVLEDQRLVSLDTLFALSDGLSKMAQTGEKGSDDLLSLAGELREFELPRPIFSNSEKVSWAPVVYTSHHAELQVQTDLTKVIKGPGTRAQLDAARGQLAPFLRDTLVGLNYAYYEPPGAQILHINPLFVRAHDFLGVSVTRSEEIWEPPVLLGAGVSAGGGAYLMGSLADLPYSLAEAEEDFIIPENVQALIWKELVPDLVMGATLPRWWNVSSKELHAVALYQRSGEELLRASATDAKTRGQVVGILSARMSPQRLEELEQSLNQEASLSFLVTRLMPGETFYLAAECRRLFPEEAESAGPAGKELGALARSAPEDVDGLRLSADFGIPHPTLARSNAREILNVQPFPFSGGYTSRLFGESLESTNLYWARLADEMGYPPVMLHRLVPELTRHMIGKIFATNIEDWPAMLRAMQETGQDLRQGKIASLRMANATPLVEQAASK